MDWFIKLFINEVKPALKRHDDSDDIVLQSKGVIIPTKAQQHIVPDEGYGGLSEVIVAAIPDEYQNLPSAEGVKF